MIMIVVRSTLAILFGVGLAVGTVVGVVEPAHASSCSVRNTDTGAVSSSLQPAVNLARAGDRLRVMGRCVGDTRVAKPLTIVGVRSDGRPESVLVGTGHGPVLRVKVATDTTVTLAELLVTGGSFDSGGGLRMGTGNLVLRGTYVRDNVNAIYARGDVTLGRDSRVVDNRGGVVVRRGSTTMNGSSRISRNVGTGIWQRSDRLVMNDSSAVSGNTGTGIDSWGTLVMNGHAEVASNGGSAGILTSWKYSTTTRLNDHASVHDNVTMGIWEGPENDVYGRVVLDDHASVYGNGDRGIRVSGDLTMNGDSSVWGNTSVRGGGVHGGSDITLNDQATVRQNTAEVGGGIFVGGRLFLNDSSAIVDNSAVDGGGVALGDECELYMHDQAVVSGNSAARGAGVFNTYLVQMDGSTAITGNTATVSGGGVYNLAGATVTVAGSAAVVGNLPDDIA
jgi:adhesin HecA-like repeat protein